jgi:hypothetical protein
LLADSKNVHILLFEGQFQPLEVKFQPVTFKIKAVPQLNFVEIVQSWHLCQIHKTPLRPMRLYSLIQLDIVAFVKCMETELSMKI